MSKPVRLWVTRQNGERTKRSTGTRSPTVVRAMQSMLDALGRNGAQAWDIVDALAWSLSAEPMEPGAPETRAALRDGGMWGDVVRKHLTLRLEFLTAYKLSRGLRIEIAAALEVTP